MTIRELAVLIKANLDMTGFKAAVTATEGVKAKLDGVKPAADGMGNAIRNAVDRAADGLKRAGVALTTFGGGMTAAQRAAVAYSIELGQNMRHADGWAAKLKVMDGALKKGVSGWTVAGEGIKAYRMQITLVTAAAAGFLGMAVKKASDAAETINAFNVTLGKNAAAVAAWTEKYAEVVRLDPTAIKAAAAGIAPLIQQANLGTKQTVELTEKLTQAVFDLQSIRNLSTDEAAAAIRSGLAGQTEALQKYGIIVDETTLKQWALQEGLLASGQEMDQTTKLNIRAQKILADMAKLGFTGDMERTSREFANTARGFMAQLDMMMQRVGDVVKAVVLPALNAVTNFMQRINKVPFLGEAIAGALTFVAAMGGLLLAVGAAAMAMAKFKQAVVILEGTRFANLAKFMTNPIRNFIPALAAAGKAIVGFVTGPVGLWTMGLTAVVLAVQDLMAGISGGTSAVAEWIAKAAQFIGINIQAKDVLNAVRGAIKWMGDAFTAVKDVMVAAGGAIVQMLRGLWDGVAKVGDVFRALFTFDVEGYFNKLRDALGGSTIAAAALAIPVGILATAVGVQLAGAAVKAAIALGQMTAALIVQKATAIGAAIAGVAQLALTMGGALVSALVGATAAAWAFTTAMLANPLTWVAAGVVAVGAAIVGLIKHWDTVTKFFSDAWEFLVSPFKAAAQWISENFNLGKILVDIANNAWGMIKAPFEAIAGWIAGLWPHSPAKHGPLRHLDQVGPGMAGQIIKGLNAARPGLEKAMTDIIPKVKATADLAMRVMVPQVDPVLVDVMPKVRAATDGVRQNVPDMPEPGPGAARGFAPAMMPMQPAMAGASPAGLSISIPYSPTYNLPANIGKEQVTDLLVELNKRDRQFVDWLVTRSRFREWLENRFVRGFSGAVENRPADEMRGT